MTLPVHLCYNYDMKSHSFERNHSESGHNISQKSKSIFHKLKGVCPMAIKDFASKIRSISNGMQFSGVTINIGFIGFNFGGGSAQANVI